MANDDAKYVLFLPFMLFCAKNGNGMLSVLPPCGMGTKKLRSNDGLSCSHKYRLKESAECVLSPRDINV